MIPWPISRNDLPNSIKRIGLPAKIQGSKRLGFSAGSLAYPLHHRNAIRFATISVSEAVEPFR